jgi:hypothetical protein
MQQKNPQRLVKIFADSLDRQMGAAIFFVLFVLFIVLYFISLFAVPQVFQYLQSNGECRYSSPMIEYKEDGCGDFNLHNKKVWQVELANMNVTNVFITVTGLISRANIEINAGLLIRGLRRIILPDRSHSFGSQIQC